MDDYEQSKNNLSSTKTVRGKVHPLAPRQQASRGGTPRDIFNSRAQTQACPSSSLVPDAHTNTW